MESHINTISLRFTNTIDGPHSIAPEYQIVSVWRERLQLEHILLSPANLCQHTG